MTGEGGGQLGPMVGEKHRHTSILMMHTYHASATVFDA